MAFRFNLALLAAILLNGAVLGDDSTCSGALAGADGERNAPSRGGEAGCKSDGRARNGDKLVVLDSARTTPSETARKSVTAVKRVSGQSSLSSRNEARNDHVGVGNELRDQPAASHKAQARAGDKHGTKLPHATRPVASRHSEGGLTTTSPRESAEVLDRKKEFESMVNGIIAEEAEAGGYEMNSDYYVNDYNRYNNGPYGAGSSPEGSGELGPGVPSVKGPSENSNNSTSGSAPTSTPGAVASSVNGQSPAMEKKDDDPTEDTKTPEDVQDQEKQNEEKMKEKKKEEEEDGKEKEEKQLEQRRNENSDERETNNSSEDTNSEKVPSAGNSPFLCGSYSSVLLVALACLCPC
ncbi:hypothetical protein ERJ75_000165400 [Trypanosoma vivax]|nr:hypothetical protein ERJ75_000165400 [Trypanosoma vivax]